MTEEEEVKYVTDFIVEYHGEAGTNPEFVTKIVQYARERDYSPVHEKDRYDKLVWDLDDFMFVTTRKTIQSSEK